MDNPAQDKHVRQVMGLLADLFELDAYYVHGHQLALSLRYRFDTARSIVLLRDRLTLAGYTFSLNPGETGILVTLDPHRKLRIPKLNIVLFFATLVSVYLVPVLLRHGVFGGTNDSFSAALHNALADLKRGAGLEFTAALMSILLVHEMGHFIASKRRNIITSWPYFIPAPNIIGTFGAVIKSKSPFWNRRDLIEVGAAGPIAGWLVALAWLVYGLTRSTIMPIGPVDISVIPFFLDGESFLIKGLVPWLVGVAGPNEYYHLTDAAFAGWVGLLVTAMNMLPIGQLDGGHVLYGLTQQRQHILGWIAVVILIGLGFQSPMWWVFAALGLIFKVPHPPTMDDERSPGTTALVVGWAAIIIFVISFTPIPFQ
jgi:hypothetical protein